MIHGDTEDLVQALKNELVSLRTDLEEKDQQIGDLKSSNQQKDNEIGDTEDLVHALKNELVSLRADLEEKDQQIDDLKSSNQQKDNEIKFLKEHLNQIIDVNKELEKISNERMDAEKEFFNAEQDFLENLQSTLNVESIDNLIKEINFNIDSVER